MLVSPQNSLEAQVKLLMETDYKFLMIAGDFSSFDTMCAAIEDRTPVTVFKVERIEHWLDDEAVPESPFTDAVGDDPSRPYIIIHSSGSTGTDKLSLADYWLILSRLSKTYNIYFWCHCCSSSVCTSGNAASRLPAYYNHLNMAQSLPFTWLPGFPCESNVESSSR